MPVTEQTPITAHVANGSTAVFPFEFLVLQASDLVVAVNSVELVSSIDYTVSGVGAAAGGSVTLAVMPPAGQSVVVFRRSRLSRDRDYQTNGDLLADALDEDADRPILILQELMAHPYIHRTGPRSTGREEFGREMAARLEGEPADLVRTAAAFSAESVALGLRRHLRGPVEIVVGGGGCENPTLMAELAARLPEATWRRFDEFGVPAGAREAAAFALMGHETAHGRPSNVPGVTGARGPKVLGKLVYP